MTAEEISELLGCGPVDGYFIWRRRHLEVMAQKGSNRIICYRHVGDRQRQSRTIMSKIDDLREWAQAVGWHEEMCP